MSNKVEFMERPFAYRISLALSPGTVITDKIHIDEEATFVLEALRQCQGSLWSLIWEMPKRRRPALPNNGPFEVRLKDHFGPGFIPSAWLESIADPFVIVPSLSLPASSELEIEIRNLSDDPTIVTTGPYQGNNLVELEFVGVKRFTLKADSANAGSRSVQAAEESANK